MPIEACVIDDNTQSVPILLSVDDVLTIPAAEVTAILPDQSEAVTPVATFQTKGFPRPTTSTTVEPFFKTTPTTLVENQLSLVPPV